MHLKNIFLTNDGLNIEFKMELKTVSLIYGLEIIAKILKTGMREAIKENYLQL